MAARTAHLLSKLVEKHPKMKLIVTLEVERLLYRTNVTQKAQYYAICFLNGIKLHRDDAELASRVVMIYFSFFKAFVAKGEIDSKMLGGLLTGVNKAYPFAKVDQQKITEQSDTLFRLIHVSNFGTSVQALMLLFQIVDASENSADRYYMALYRKLLDAELPVSSKLPMFLNLLLKSMKKDSLLARMQAFIKRLMQVAMSFAPALACSALLLLSELMKDRPNLLNLTKEAEEEEDEEEHFVDVKEEDDETAVDGGEGTEAADTKTSKTVAAVVPSWVHRDNLSSKKDKYDPLHRNPLFCRAEKDCTWELRNLARHYHPSVQVFANTLLQGQTIDYSSNPLEDFSLQRFLDRFITRNAKKKSGGKDDEEGQSDEEPVKKNASDDDSDDFDGDDDEDEEDIDDDDSEIDDAIDKFEIGMDVGDF